MARDSMAARLRPMARALWWEWQRLLSPGGRRVVLNGVATIMVDPAVNAGRGSRWNYETQWFRRFLASIQPNDVVFDVGANQGLFAIPAGQRVGPAGCIYAFEPAPSALLVLQRQIDLNQMQGVVRPVGMLAGQRSAPDGVLHAASTAVGWASAAYAPPGTAPVYTATVALDDFAALHNVCPAVIKIDVEGYEGEVLAGAERLLVEHAPIVFCALHPEILPNMDTTSAAIIRWMRDRGYVASTAHGRRAGERDTEIIFRKRAS